MDPNREFLIDGLYSFKEAVDLKRLQAIFEHFSQSTSRPVRLFSYPDHEILISIDWRDIPDKFPHTFLGSEEGVTPIIIRGVHVADLQVVENIPFMTETKLKNDLGFLSEMSIMLAEYGLAAIATRSRIQAIQKSEDHLRTTLRSIGDAVIATDDRGIVTSLNPVAETLTGWLAQEAIGKELREIFHIINAKTREITENPIQQVLTSGKTSKLANNTILISRNGTERKIADSAAPIINNEQLVSGVVLVFRDVTEKYRMQEAIEKRLVALTQPLEGGIITFEVLFNTKEIQRIQDEFSQATGVASIITRPDGTPITKASNFTDLCSKIIRKTELGCANCFKSDSAIGRYHPNGPIVQPCLSGGLWDAGASITVGGQHIANWMIGQVRDETQTEDNMRAYARQIGADEPTFMEAFHKVPAMSHEHFLHIAQALFTLSNQLSSSAYQNVQQARFISERQHAEEALKRQNSLFASLLKILPLGIFMVKAPSGKLLVANEAALHLLGRGILPDVSEQNLSQVYKAHKHGSREPYPLEEMPILLGMHGKTTHVDDMVVERPDGTSTLLEVFGTPVADDEGKVWASLVCFFDISERKAVEAELLKMQKLASVGTLAGGIAHDFNNILMGLFGNISMAKTEIPIDSPGYKPLEDAEKSMYRAIRLTKQLLTFAKGGEPVKEDVSLESLVEEVAQFDLSGSNVMLVYKQAPHLWIAKADKGQIQQVISNLTINAREAMPNGGHLYISLENSEIMKDNISSLHPGKYIKVIVRDEGIGIDPETIDRIFEPYFTTKHTGSGLGLATTYSIITKHGGYIEVASELGKGATFTFYLPTSESQSSPPTKAIVPESPIPKASARILVMDDEEFIRMIIPRWLKRIGFTAETAADGPQTVTLYKQAFDSGTPFDAVILDLTIPGGIGGQEVLQEILAIDPSAKAIVSSGYAESPIMANFSKYGFKGVLAKPYTEAQLQNLSKQILTPNNCPRKTGSA